MVNSNPTLLVRLVKSANELANNHNGSSEAMQNLLMTLVILAFKSPQLCEAMYNTPGLVDVVLNAAKENVTKSGSGRSGR